MEQNLKIYPMLKTKRFFDIFVSFLILIVVSPFVITLVVIQKCEQILRGRVFDPIFYHEQRVSHGKTFNLHKFNIFKQEKINMMRARGEFIHTKKLERNGGLTKVGWLLTRIYMDELPQFFNVIRGDMSIVGPRPLNPVALKKALEQGQTSKLQVLAGITGNQQSRKDQVGHGMQLDQEYVSYYGNNPWYKVLLFDFSIILRTFRFVLKAQGI